MGIHKPRDNFNLKMLVCEKHACTGETTLKLDILCKTTRQVSGYLIIKDSKELKILLYTYKH